jgi:hypothetical protein
MQFSRKIFLLNVRLSIVLATLLLLPAAVSTAQPPHPHRAPERLENLQHSHSLLQNGRFPARDRVLELGLRRHARRGPECRLPYRGGNGRTRNLGLHTPGPHNPRPGRKTSQRHPPDRRQFSHSRPGHQQGHRGQHPGCHLRLRRPRKQTPRFHRLEQLQHGGDGRRNHGPMAQGSGRRHRRVQQRGHPAPGERLRGFRDGVEKNAPVRKSTSSTTAETRKPPNATSKSSSPPTRKSAASSAPTEKPAPPPPKPCAK